MRRLLAVAAVVAGCSSSAPPEPPPPAPAAAPAPVAAAPGAFADTFSVAAADWASSGRNPYFVLEPGYVLELEGEEDGEPVRLTITVLGETRTVDGVETRVVEERETEGGELKEVSRNYFAFSRGDGGVYYFGEDVDEYEDGKLSGHGGSWHAGENGARFGLFMPGAPEAGMRHYQEFAPGVAMDRAEVVAVGDVFEAPAGTFRDCLKVEETTPIEKAREVKVYAKGVGLVKDGGLRLVRFGRAAK